MISASRFSHAILYGVAFLLAREALSQPVPSSAPHPKAPAEACAGKLDAIATGVSQDVESDLDWLSNYCEPNFHEKAVDMIADATADAAISGTLERKRAATQRAREEIAEVNAGANSANSAIAADTLAAMTPGPTTVVVVAGGPVPHPHTATPYNGPNNHHDHN